MDNQHKRKLSEMTSDDEEDAQGRNFSGQQQRQLPGGTPHLSMGDNRHLEETFNPQFGPANPPPQQLSPPQGLHGSAYSPQSRIFPPGQQERPHQNVSSLNPQTGPFPQHISRQQQGFQEVQSHPSVHSSSQFASSPQLAPRGDQRFQHSPMPGQPSYFRPSGNVLNHEFGDSIHWTLRGPANPYSPSHRPYAPTQRQFQPAASFSPPNPSPPAQLNTPSIYHPAIRVPVTPSLPREEQSQQASPSSPATQPHAPERYHPAIRVPATPSLPREELAQQASPNPSTHVENNYRNTVSRVLENSSIPPEIRATINSNQDRLTQIYHQIESYRESQRAGSQPAAGGMRAHSNSESSREGEQSGLASQASSTPHRGTSSISSNRQHENSMSNSQLQYPGQGRAMAESQLAQENARQPGYPVPRANFTIGQDMSLPREDYPVGQAGVSTALGAHNISITRNTLIEADRSFEIHLQQALQQEFHGTDGGRPTELNSQPSTPLITQNASLLANPQHHSPVRHVGSDPLAMIKILHQFIRSLPKGQPSAFNQDIFMDTELFTKSPEVRKPVRVEDSFMQGGKGWTEETLVPGKPATYRDYTVLTAWQSIKSAGGEEVRVLCTISTKKFPRGAENGKWVEPATALPPRKRQKLEDDSSAASSDPLVWNYSATASMEDSDLRVKCPVEKKVHVMDGVEYEVEPDWDDVVEALQRAVRGRETQMGFPTGGLPQNLTFTEAQLVDTNAYVQQLTSSSMEDVERLQRQRISSLTQSLQADGRGGASGRGQRGGVAGRGGGRRRRGP